MAMVLGSCIPLYINTFTSQAIKVPCQFGILSLKLLLVFMWLQADLDQVHLISKWSKLAVNWRKPINSHFMCVYTCISVQHLTFFLNWYLFIVKLLYQCNYNSLPWFVEMTFLCSTVKKVTPFYTPWKSWMCQCRSIHK